ncbi:hydantoinase B/oxoprolinase family protein [Pseudonocardia xishanensis]|uniref:Hydantoinase B/oxoprolinase family protein n=1 Tax=Pseudonocardia xishanensis TaxID=630995 RepID=A0ABP8S0B4_9PSEU
MDAPLPAAPASAADAPPLDDPVGLEVFRNSLVGVAEEMGEVMMRAALSPMIKERNDRSCAVFTRDLQLVAQAEHLPIHLALLVRTVPAALAELREPLRPGDVSIHNDPYLGGSHLPDITSIAPIYDAADTELLGYCAVIAHMADIGGSTPGGVGGLARDIIEEGVLIPPVRIVRGGRVVAEVLDLLMANVRLPEVLRGDLLAQIAAVRAGGHAVRDLAEAVTADRFHEMCRQILDYSGRRTRTAIENLPTGEAQFVDVVDDDGLGNGPLPVSVRIRIDGDGVEADFTGSAPQLAAPVNASLAVTRSAVFYVVRCLIDASIPTTAACFDAVRVVAPEGSIVNATAPAPVGGGSLETAQRIVDAVMGAFAQLVPDLVTAAGMGSHNTIAIGGTSATTGRRFVLTENLSGGGGARAGLDGVSVRRVNLMNTPNTPVEVLEREIPVRVVRCEMRDGSGGEGRTVGGLGLRKEYEFAQDCSVSILADRQVNAPWGLFGGGSAQGSSHELVRADGTRETLPSKVALTVHAGDRLIAQTAGGGGYGPAAVTTEEETP